MSNIKLDFKYSNTNTKNILKYSDEVLEIHTKFQKNKNKEEEFLGWIDWPSKYNKREFEKIKKCALKIREDSQILVVIGIGGS